MKRRDFLKTSAGLSSALLLRPSLEPLFAATGGSDSGEVKAYQPGESISPAAFVLDKEMNQHTVLSLCQENTEAMVNVLYIFGGGAMGKDKLGSIWCQDSFEDLQILRFIHMKYEDAPVQLIPVACAPVYSTQYYGHEKGIFLNEPDDSEKFKAAVEKFIESTQKSVDDGFIPVQPYLDVRLRLMFNRDEDLKPGAGYGKIYPWQGRFRADDETQKYGVPTIWLLNPDGMVLEKPFHGNYYRSDPWEINYTIVDVDQALQKYI